MKPAPGTENQNCFPGHLNRTKSGIHMLPTDSEK